MKKKNENFFLEVYEVVKLIPKGRVTSYGTIAKFLGMKSGARMVGWALNSSFGEKYADLPAHRVVNNSGLLTGKHHFATPTLMADRLKEEGVPVEKDKVKDFKKYHWDPAIELEIE